MKKRSYFEVTYKGMTKEQKDVVSSHIDPLIALVKEGEHIGHWNGFERVWFIAETKESKKVIEAMEKELSKLDNKTAETSTDYMKRFAELSVKTRKTKDEKDEFAQLLAKVMQS